MNRRFELTDEEWARLAPLLPAMTPRRGGRWRDHRQVSTASCSRPASGALAGSARALWALELAAIREAAANVEPRLREDNTRIWSLMQLERQLRPEAYSRRRGGYLDRRRIPAADAWSIRDSVLTAYGAKCYGRSGQAGSNLLHAIHGML